MLEHTTIPLRRTGVAALVGVLALCSGALTACGSDTEKESSSGSKATTTAAPASGAAQTIAENFNSQTGLDVDEAAATCMGDAMVTAMGDERAVEVFESNDELNELSAEDQTTIRTAFNDCVPGSAVAEAAATDFYMSIGASSEPDAETVTCLGTALDGHSGDAMWSTYAEDQSDPALAATLAAFEECMPTSVRAELFTATLSDAGLPEAQVTCIANALAGELTLSELAEIGSNPEMSADFEARITAASSSCA